MKKCLPGFLCLVLVFLPCVLHAQEYSLEDLFSIALERSERIKAAEEDVNISERTKDKALAVLLPTMSAFGTHTRYSEKQTRGSLILQPEHTNEWGVRLDQSLSLSGREFTAFDIAKKGLYQSRLSLDAVKAEYLLTVAAAYFDVLKLQKALDIADANVERLTKHRNAAKTRLEVGRSTKTALLRAEAELSGARSDRIRTRNSLRLAKSVLARRVGIGGGYTLREAAGIDTYERPGTDLGRFTPGCTMQTLECLKEKAFSEKPEIRALTVQKEIAESDITYTRGSYWPDVSVEGVYVREENEPSSSFGLEERVYGAVSLDFPFFEGGLRKAEVGEARARLRQVEYNLADLKESVSIEVEDAYLNLLTVSSVITQLKAELEYARDNYNVVTKQFKHGLSDSIDVIDANTLLVTAEKELSNAGYDYQLAIIQLQRATGMLVQTALNGRSSTAAGDRDN